MATAEQKSDLPIISDSKPALVEEEPKNPQNSTPVKISEESAS